MSNCDKRVIVRYQNIIATVQSMSWLPIFGIDPHENGVVLTLLDYENGEGDKPDEYIGWYMGVSEWVENISDALVFGRQGDAFAFEDFTPEQILLLQQPAIEAADIANDATNNANVATQNAISATNAAIAATDNAITATNEANLAKGATLQAIEDAEGATANADAATNLANQAAQNADSKASLAQTAADNANQATSNANTATQAANEAAITANNAKGWQAIESIENYQGKELRYISGWQGGTGVAPTTNVGLYFKVGGGFTDDKELAVNFKGEKGDKGETGDAGAMTIYTRDEFNQLPRPLNAADLRITSAAALIPRFVKNEGKGFAFQGDELVYPYYAGKESMVLHYDFSGMKNTDVTKGIARDLSGNVNNGVLNGFGYVAGSGYQDGGLKFDGVDDRVEVTLKQPTQLNGKNTYEATFIMDELPSVKGKHFQVMKGAFYIHNANNRLYLHNTGFSTDQPLEAKRKYVVCITQDGDALSCNIYINGILQTVREGTPYQLGGFSETGLSLASREFVGIILSARITVGYTLTPAEVQHNYQIDKQRFNLP